MNWKRRIRLTSDGNGRKASQGSAKIKTPSPGELVELCARCARGRGPGGGGGVSARSVPARSGSRRGRAPRPPWRLGVRAVGACPGRVPGAARGERAPPGPARDNACVACAEETAVSRGQATRRISEHSGAPGPHELCRRLHGARALTWPLGRRA